MDELPILTYELAGMQSWKDDVSNVLQWGLHKQEKGYKNIKIFVYKYAIMKESM